MCEIGCVCIQLLGELLLDRHNFTVMTRYISNPENLKVMMMMLKDKSRNIQFEAFHVFKVWPLISDIVILYCFMCSLCNDQIFNIADN